MPPSQERKKTMNPFNYFHLQESRKRAVWSKGHKVLGFDPSIVRQDDKGYRIYYAEYGNRLSEYGWEIDHITPVALGGPDDISNLRPLHWRANARLGGLLGSWLA